MAAILVNRDIDHFCHCEKFYWTTGLSTGDSDLRGKGQEESQTSSDQNNVQYTCTALHVIHDLATSNVKAMPVGQPKMGGSWWRDLTECGPLEKGMANQYSCLENSMNSMKRQNDRILKEELPRSVGAQYATEDQWRNNFRKNEGMEPKQKQYPAMDM